MQLLADKNGEQFLQVHEQDQDRVTVQFMDTFGQLKGKPFSDSLAGLLLVGWTYRSTSTAIGLSKFRQGITEDLEVSFALHQRFPLGRKVKLPSGVIATIASYANTHSDGYYLYVRVEERIERHLLTPNWKILPSEELLRLPYYPKPLTQQELNTISEFDSWAGGF